MTKLFKHLTFYVLIAIIAGILLGHYFPEYGLKMQIVGETFINIIKLFIVPIIFLTIVLGIGSMGNLRKVGRIGLKSLIYFEVVTTLALAIGIFVALLVQPGKFDTSGMTFEEYKAKPKEVMTVLLFMKNYMSLLTLGVALICGIGLNFYTKRAGIIHNFEKASKFVFKILKYVMYLAPLAAFGAMAFTVAKYGLDKLVPLGKMVLCVYGTMILFILLILGGIMRYNKLRILSFLRYIREEILIVLGTSSSESALPKLMEKLETAGCKKSVVGLVVPTGYSFNLDGTSIYLSMSVIFLAQVNNVSLSFGQIMMMIGILMLTSKGAAGVAGSGFVVLSSTIASFPEIPAVSLAFLLGIDKFLSEARAITNFVGNGVATLVIAKSENEFDERLYETAVNKSY